MKRLTSTGLAIGVLLSTSGWLPAAPQPAPAPSVGEVFPSFVADGIDGTPVYVDYPKGSTTVLIFFLSGCPHCLKMIPEWNRAFERKPKSLKVVGVLMDKEPPGFFIATPVAFPVVRAPGQAFLRSAKVNRAPLTLRVGAAGTVEEVGAGELDPIRLGEIFRR
jgi:thiol-disulfide isomerase/thioredoxin